MTPGSFVLTHAAKRDIFECGRDFYEWHGGQYWNDGGLQKLVELGIWKREIDAGGFFVCNPPNIAETKAKFGIDASVLAFDASVAAARAEGVAEGQKNGGKAVTERIAAILGDDKVKGKERAALDLAMKSPDMSAADVVTYVAAMAAPRAGIPTIAERMAAYSMDFGPPIPRGAAEQDMPDAKAIFERRRIATS